MHKKRNIQFVHYGSLALYMHSISQSNLSDKMFDKLVFKGKSRIYHH